MNRLRGSLIGGAVVAFLGLWFVYQSWLWTFCRFYVPPGFMAVVSAKNGDPLPPGQILAAAGQIGIREDVLGEGRHFLNPIFYDVEIRPVVTIPAGNVGIVTSKVGAELPSGEFLADRGQKGIWRGVLGPGKYRMNPYGYEIQVVDAISVPIGYAGVVTSLSGEQAPAGDFAAPRQKGVRRDVLQPGLYYVNPKQVRVDLLEIGVNQVSLLGKQGGAVITKTQMATQNVAIGNLQKKALADQLEKRMEYAQRVHPGLAAKPSASADAGARAPGAPAPQARIASAESSAAMNLYELVEFPSRDGFAISLDMTVEFELRPERIAGVYRSYGDLPAVVDKILMPQILSISRLKGSAYRAKDFIVGEGREKFQADLTTALRNTLGEKNIIVHNALIRHVNVPMQILSPIQLASVAVEQDLTNEEKQNTAKKQAELNTELELIEQRRQQVAQETEKLKAEIKATREKEVAEIRGTTLKEVAEIAKATALVRADRERKLGQARANVTALVEGERANGFVLETRAFGDPSAYALWKFARSLSPDVRIRILHAGDGTLWTDLERATLGDLGGSAILDDR